MNLDDPALYDRVDPGDMHRYLFALPDVCMRAWQEGLTFALPTDYRDFRQIIVLGMGGSAIGADLLSSLAAWESPVPVLVHRHYDLPAYVDDTTLVIASSYSGETEETLTAFEQALSNGAKTLVLTTGGRLLSLAERHKVPALRFQYPAQPRAAIGYSFMLLLAVAQQVGLFEASKGGDVSEAVAVLTALRDQLGIRVPQSSNPGKQHALWLHQRVPIIYGAERLVPVARRWKTQLNENAKTWAFVEELPEANHNTIEGLDLPTALLPLLNAVFLYAPSFSPRILVHLQATRHLLEAAGIECAQITAWGSSHLAQMLSVLYIGDWVSYYLAVLNRVAPTPTPRLDAVKRYLAEHQRPR